VVAKWRVLRLAQGQNATSVVTSPLLRTVPTSGRHVVDARGAVQFDISSDEIRQVAETSVLAPSARRAMVATDRALFDGLRTYRASFELQVDGSAVGAFTTLDDAIEWVTP
jgi:hypothetical protein